MCGIVGLFGRSGAPAPFQEHWPALVELLRHRGPNEGAFWGDGPFFLGHRRLSVIDLESGEQPMATADGRLVVACNGEIYNYRELREELRGLGYSFTTASDTEVILHGYDAWREDLLPRLTGMFAIAVADRIRGELFLARDRFGEKPLLLLRQSGYVAFASEMRALSALPGIERRVDEAALAGFLTLNYVPGTSTLMEGVQRLKPGHWIRFSESGEQAGCYWGRPPATQPENSRLTQLLPEWRERFDHAVRLCLRSDVPVGVLLSGGVDSSLVAESAVRQGNLKAAYFLDFEERSHSELDAAKTVAGKLGLPLREVTLDSSVLSRFSEMVSHADDPLADSSALAVWCVTELAAREVRVVLGGDGADELFGGYLTYRASELHRRFISRLPAYLRRGLASMSQVVPTSEGKVTPSYKLHRFLRAAALPTAQAHATWNGAWMPSEVAALLAAGGEHAEEVLPGLVRAHGLSERPEQTELQRADIGEYLPNDILVKIDRMSMAHGLEVRAPFLNHELAEWALAHPVRSGFLGKQRGKLLLRAAAEKIYGPAIANRAKQGFSIPVHQWLRSASGRGLRELLAPESVASTGVLNVNTVTGMLAQHLSGRMNLGFELWGLCTFVMWYRQRIAQPPTLAGTADITERIFDS